MMIADYINEVLARFEEGMGNISEDITDRVFLMIQENPQLYQEYQNLIETGNSKRGLNARLGKMIREYFCPIQTQLTCVRLKRFLLQIH